MPLVQIRREVDDLRLARPPHPYRPLFVEVPPPAPRTPSTTAGAISALLALYKQLYGGAR